MLTMAMATVSILSPHRPQQTTDDPNRHHDHTQCQQPLTVSIPSPCLPQPVSENTTTQVDDTPCVDGGSDQHQPPASATMALVACTSTSQCRHPSRLSSLGCPLPPPLKPFPRGIRKCNAHIARVLYVFLTSACLTHIRIHIQVYCRSICPHWW